MILTFFLPERFNSLGITSIMASQTSPKRVLIVDDNDDAADLVAELLQIYGYSVRTAYSGAEGINEAFAFMPHLVLLDLGMPGMDGFAVATVLRNTADYQQPYLVAYTAWNDVATKNRVMASGFDRHMTKPANFQEIVDMVAALPAHH